ncbi:MAG: hypothetical protein GTO41_06205, partial [Burkholderiales bacterium]|nr:hypothetical protein [Burkholderiales bacterium]
NLLACRVDFGWVVRTTQQKIAPLAKLFRNVAIYVGGMEFGDTIIGDRFAVHR